MGYALDGIILGICLLCVLIGVQRGFIRSVVHFLGAVIAACLASALGGVVAQWLFDSLFRQAMVEKISDSLQGLGAENAAAAVEQIIASLPDFLVRALEEAGVTAASITGGIGVQTGQAAQLITDYLSPVFVNFLKVLVVIVLFSLFMTLVRILAGVVSRMLRLPIIHQLDGLLGGIFGFLLAMVSVDEGMQQQINGALDSSFLAGTLIRLNPLRGLFS